MRQTKFSFRLLFTSGLFLLFCTFFALPISAANVSLEVDSVLPAGESIFVRYTGASSKSWLGVAAEGETEPVRLELDGQASGASLPFCRDVPFEPLSLRYSACL